MGKMPTRNWVAKILSLILASILWIYVMNEQNPAVEATFTVPLEVRNLSDTLIMQDSPDTIRVKVRGPRSLVAGVAAGDIHSYIDLKGLEEGKHNIKVRATVPSSLELMDITPDNITIRLETYVQKVLPIEIKVNGLPPGVAPGKVIAQPETITVEGPKSMVGAAVKAVAIIDLTGKTSDFSVDVPISVVNSNGKDVQGILTTPDKINITYKFTQALMKKVVSVRPAFIGEPNAGYSVKSVAVEPDKVEVTGDAKTLEALDFIETKPISLTGLSKNIEQDIKLELKEGLSTAKDAVKIRIFIGLH